MKNIYFFLILTLLIGISCQSTNKQYISIINYNVINSNFDGENYDCFLNNHKFSSWAMHRCSQIVDDTLIFAALSNKKDTIYIYNFGSYQSKKIALNQIPKYSIFTIYYHNHDSIFIFYDRNDIYKSSNDEFDFILINEKGEIKNTYSLKDVPFIFKGNYYNAIRISNVSMKDRIINGNLLLTFSIMLPSVDNPDFINFHPRQLGLYNLSTKTVKMLNVKFPLEDIGKKYNTSCHPNSFLISYDKNKNVVINFPFSNILYRYDFIKDTLIKINCKYDNTFRNIDSTQMDTNKNYLSLKFKDPVWDIKNYCYFRYIEILNNEEYQHGGILQVMDSNYNHIAYLLNNEEYNTPFYVNNRLQASNKVNQLPYNIQLGEKIKRISWKEFESQHLIKKNKGSGKIISFDKYLTRLNIPKNSLVIIINLNYPCGHCLEYLFTKMKENENDFEKSNIYYVIYNNNNENYSKTLLNNYNLSNSKLIRMDSVLLVDVRYANKSVIDYKYRIIDYQSEDKVIKVYSCAFEKLPALFDKLITQREKKIIKN